jgi:hypothetical protein
MGALPRQVVGRLRCLTTLGPQVTTEDFAERARRAVLDPQRNPVLEHFNNPSAGPLHAHAPLLGLFNDIPASLFRETEARAWARAGFSFVVNDAEHSGWQGWYGREHNAALLRLGLTPIQRLPREARSAHGDALSLGARGTMRPYASTVQDAVEYLACLSLPDGTSEPTPLHRGAYPARSGDGTPAFSVEGLRRAESGKVLACLQFETADYIADAARRDTVIDLLAAFDSGRGGVAFVGGFDAAMRAVGRTFLDELGPQIAAVHRTACEHGVPSGAVVGWSGQSHDDAEDASARIETAIDDGCRLIAAPVFASDLPLHGATTVAAPFHAAVARWRRKRGARC